MNDRFKQFKTNNTGNRVGVSNLNHVREGHLHLGRNGEGYIAYYMGNSATGSGEYTSQRGYFSTNIWHDIKIIKTGQNISYYCDDTLIDSRTCSWINNLDELAVSICNWQNATSTVKNIIIEEMR